MREKVIKCSLQLWDRMPLSLKIKLYDSVEVINSKEEVKEKDGRQISSSKE